MTFLLPVFRKAYLVLGIGLVFYTSTVCLVTLPFIQRHAIYVHKLNTLFWHDVNSPEQFGFARNQVTPFNIKTPDRQVLYAWHILPLGIYAENQDSLLAAKSGFCQDVTSSKAFNLLKEDPEARLIIEFHGNTGHVAQGWRPESYKALAATDTHKIHILAIDYRGFGHSSGSPTEQGLITDGIAAVNWALETAKIPSSRIVLLGQSLGTAVTSAVATHFAQEQSINFAAVILIAGFTSIPNLLTSYSLGGWVPFLSPLRQSPLLEKWFTSRFLDTWNSAERVADLIHYSTRCNLLLYHAKNDYDIPWLHSEALFAAAANATSSVADGYKPELFQKMKERHTVYHPDGVGFVSEWKVSEHRVVREEILSSGGHNRIMTSPQVALGVWRAFGLKKTVAEDLGARPTEYYVT